MKLRICAAVSLLLVLGACGGTDDTSAPVDAPTVTTLSAKQACDALATVTIDASSIALPTRGGKVTSATLVAPFTSSVSFSPYSIPVPEHCFIKGEITSIDANAEPISFTLALPTQWNKRLMQLGGAGWDGVPREVTTDGYTVFLTNQEPVPLARGYAVFGSDSGHTVHPGSYVAAFALNDEMLRNFADEHIKKTRDAVVALVHRRYTHAIQKTYFMGTSEGGRESMIAMQRYPADYDAVVTFLPVFNWVPSFFKWHQIGRAMRTNGGAGWLSPAKATLVYNAQISACDSLDGVADGIISNVRACTFDPAILRCANGADTGNTCLSDAQIATTQVMYSRTSWNYDLANGVRSIPAYYPGTSFPRTVGTTAQFNLADVVAGNGATSLGSLSNFGDSLIRYVILQEKNADTLSFDPTNPPAAYLPRIKAASMLLDATSTDISAFLAKGGKWILTQGLADELPPNAGLSEYFDSLVTRFKRTELDKSVRYYTIPGYAHAAGTFNALNGIPALDALENWVENGVAPGNLVTRDVTLGRTRPMCVYPTWPKYKGTGDVNQATSFDCVSS